MVAVAARGWGRSAVGAYEHELRRCLVARHLCNLPLGRRSHEAVLRQRAAPGELRPAYRDTASNGCACTTPGRRGDEEALDAVRRLPRRDVRAGQHHLAARTARRMRKRRCRQLATSECNVDMAGERRRVGHRDQRRADGEHESAEASRRNENDASWRQPFVRSQHGARAPQPGPLPTERTHPQRAEWWSRSDAHGGALINSTQLNSTLTFSQECAPARFPSSQPYTTR